jgi:polyisoprenoid-binding protein YceI
VELELHGVTQQRQLSLDWQQVNSKTLAANGSFSILQSDFGIAAFSIMNGLIRVEDRLDISFQLTATLD